jgi:hypothetical protein
VAAGWSVAVKGPATIMTPPEGGSHIVYVDVEAEDAESALAKAWAAYKEPRWPLKVVDEQADDNGWSRRKRFEYQTSPNERRDSKLPSWASRIWLRTRSGNDIQAYEEAGRGG